MASDFDNRPPKPGSQQHLQRVLERHHAMKILARFGRSWHSVQTQFLEDLLFTV